MADMSELHFYQILYCPMLQQKQARERGLSPFISPIAVNLRLGKTTVGSFYTMGVNPPPQKKWPPKVHFFISRTSISWFSTELENHFFGSHTIDEQPFILTFRPANSLESSLNAACHFSYAGGSCIPRRGFARAWEECANYREECHIQEIRTQNLRAVRWPC